MVEDLFDMLSMISYVIRIDQNIIKIDCYTDIKEIREDVIYKALKGSKSISKTKEYNRLFEGFVIDMECSLLFIAFNNID